MIMTLLVRLRHENAYALQCPDALVLLESPVPAISVSNRSNTIHTSNVPSQARTPDPHARLVQQTPLIYLLIHPTSGETARHTRSVPFSSLANECSHVSATVRRSTSSKASGLRASSRAHTFHISACIQPLSAQKDTHSSYHLHLYARKKSRVRTARAHIFG